MTTSRKPICATVAAIAVCFATTSGCVKNVTGPGKTKSEKTTQVDPPPKIATKPDADELGAAVAASKGDVAKALEAIGAHCEENAAREIAFVDLSGKKLTSKSLAHLAKLKDSLQRICLDDTYVTGEALRALAELPRLRKLDLNRTPLNDDALAELSKLKQLRELSLRQTRVGDAGIEHLTGLVELRLLSLSGTQITDAGLAHLGRLPKLTTLILDDTAVTDDGLKHLHASSSLRYLHLAGTKVTPAAVRGFRGTNPRAQIVGK